VEWKGYPNRENSLKPVEGLENAEDLLQVWWTDNMPGKNFLLFFPAILWFVLLLLRRVMISTLRSLP